MTIYGKDFWEIVKPLETTNLVQNPSMETGTTGWAGASGAAVARTTASQFFGIYGLQVTPTSASSDGAYYGADSLRIALTGSLTYYYSVYFKGQAGIGYNMFITNADGSNQQSSCTQWTATGNWERQGLLFEPQGSGSRRLYVTKDGSADTGVFILDGVQMEEQGEASTYCDGDQLGCIWLADPHGSKSWRDGESKAGGQIVNLNSEYDIIVRQMPGAGMPPVDNISTNLGIQDGGLFQRTKTNVRSLTLEGVVTGSDTNDFHYQRQRLIDLFKPDQGAPQGPFLLRYTTASAVTKQIKAHYDSGLEMTQIDANKEFFSARVISYDPYWEEIKDNADQATVYESYSSRDFSIIAPTLGQWKHTTVTGGTGANKAKVIIGEDNKVYFAGGFTSPGYRVARYNVSNATTESFLPTGTACGLNSTVWAMTFDSNGDLYLGGDFTIAGSIAPLRIVKWDGNDFVQVAGGDGFDGSVRSLAFDAKTGILYVGGAFSNSGSISIDGIAKLIPGNAEFAQVGDGITLTGGTQIIDTIKVENSGSNFYVGGTFDTSGSLSPSRLAYFNGVEFDNVGGASINNNVNDIEIKPDDTVFICGDFDGVFPDSAGSPKRITYWDGTVYSLGDSAPGGNVRGISYDESTGFLHVVGVNVAISGALDGGGSYLIWNGTSWLYSGLNHTQQTDSVVAKDGLIAVGSDGYSGGMAPQKIIYNEGTATTPPEIIFETSASARIYYIENITASKMIQMNGYIIRPGERVTLSPEKGEAFSTFRGSIIGEILPGSNFSTWALLPSNNTTDTLCSASDITPFVKWKNKHWSIDGGFS